MNDKNEQSIYSESGNYVEQNTNYLLNEKDEKKSGNYGKENTNYLLNDKNEQSIYSESGNYAEQNTNYLLNEKDDEKTKKSDKQSQSTKTEDTLKISTNHPSYIESGKDESSFSVNYTYTTGYGGTEEKKEKEEIEIVEKEENKNNNNQQDYSWNNSFQQILSMNAETNQEKIKKAILLSNNIIKFIEVATPIAETIVNEINIPNQNK